MSYMFADADAREFETYLVSLDRDDVTNALITFVYAHKLNGSETDYQVLVQSKYAAILDIAVAVSKRIEAGEITPRAPREVAELDAGQSRLAVLTAELDEADFDSDDVTVDYGFTRADDDDGSVDNTYTDDDLAAENNEVSHLVKD